MTSLVQHLGLTKGHREALGSALGAAQLAFWIFFSRGVEGYQDGAS